MSQQRKRRAVVTGAASGIGRAVAQRLVHEGVEVLAVDVAAEELEALAGPDLTTMVANVAEERDRARIAAAADGFDFLVNSAGIIRIKSIFEFTLQDWREIMTTNAESIFFLCQAIGPRLRPGGAIVNLSSASAKLAATIEAAPYAASKTAILSITRSFAYALASRPIRVNAICPGIIDTPMQDKLVEEVARERGTTARQLSEQRIRTIPLGRVSSAEECAGAIWFMLSDDAIYMTGQAMNFTGGQVMW